MVTQEKPLYTLIPLEDFKAVLGIDDREDKLARFCLITATFTIEQYCKRRFLRKKYFETVEYSGDLIIPLREYPVTSVLAVYLYGNGEILEPEFYSVLPDCSNQRFGTDIDIQFTMPLSPALQRYRNLSAVKVVYWAGYGVNPHPCGFTPRSFCSAKTPTKARVTAASMPHVPADLASACLELASWNMNRYRGRRVGMTGNIRGAGKEGEHFEMSMPENVKQLLEPYRRKLI
jgi:hypothetical protein